VDRIDLSLVQYDVRTGAQRPLVAQPLRVNPTAFTWNPTMTRGLFSVTSSICAGIGAMTRDRIVDLSLAIVVDGRSHRLDEDLRSPGSADCSNEIKADLPAWSPDGSRIAFLASPQAIGVGGFGRLDAPWNLYLVGADDDRPVPVLGGLVEPRRLVWSPSGRFLAYSGQVTGRWTGIWLYSVASRQLQRLATGSFPALAWSPSGSQIAAVHDLTSAGAKQSTEILIFDLGSASASP